MNDEKLDRLLSERKAIETPPHLANNIIHNALSAAKSNSIQNILCDVLGFKPAVVMALTLLLGLAIGTNLPQEEVQTTTALSEFYDDIIDEGNYL
jgi:hypothetical protein